MATIAPAAHAEMGCRDRACTVPVRRSHWIPRTASHAVVVLAFGSANHDTAQFNRPEEFDPQRPNSKSHLAFSSGIDACLGALLARLQAQIALDELARRFVTVRCASDNDFVYEPSFMLRGLTKLSLVFE